ncbi:organic cation transporter protein-like isoform X1 [Rhopilema esculentum]|uniref:organic cation transporter protein-like isoform X1 n=1 Tax=Rhopilema esculentum TaxID=499914 RepID=UPI0031DA52EE
MEVSELITLLGDPGKFQSVLYFLLWLCNSTVAMNHLIMSVFGAAPPHSCKLPPGFMKNATTTPYAVRNGKTLSTLDSCKIFDGLNATLGKSIGCPDGWIFQTQPRESSIVTEWTLVCDKKYMGSLAVTIYFAGVMIGGVIFGMISDRFGRRRVLLFTMYAHIIFGVAVAFIPNYTGFVTLRFIIGFLMQGLQSSSFVLMVEMTPIRLRTTVAGLFEVFWAVGTIWMASLSWMIKSWRDIQLALCLPSLVTIIYIWLVPESIRWHITHNKHKEALGTAAKIASLNKKPLPGDLSIEVSTSVCGKQPADYNIMDLFRTPKIRKRAIIMFYIWMTSSLGYYGLSLSASSLTGNRYLNIFISSFVELPAFVMIIYVLHRFGRRYPLCVYYTAGGASCIIAGTIPSKTSSGRDIKMVATVFALTGKFFIAAGFASIFLFTSELFPTIIRNVAMGGCTFWTRAGGMLAPQILLLSHYTFKELPFLVFGGLSLVAAGVSLLLPETRGIKLPDMIEDVEGSKFVDLELKQTENDAEISNEDLIKA